MRRRLCAFWLVLMIVAFVETSQGTPPACTTLEGKVDQKWMKAKICTGQFFNFSRTAYSSRANVLFAAGTHTLYRINVTTLEILQQVDITNGTSKAACIAACNTCVANSNNFPYCAQSMTPTPSGGVSGTCPDRLLPLCENSVSLLQIEKDSSGNEHLVTCTTASGFADNTTCQIRNVSDIRNVTQEFRATLTVSTLMPYVHLLLGSGTGNGVDSHGLLSGPVYTAGYVPGDFMSSSHLVSPSTSAQFNYSYIAALQRSSSLWVAISGAAPDFTLKFVQDKPDSLDGNPNLHLSQGESRFFLQYAYDGHIYIWGSGIGTDSNGQALQGSFIYRYCMNDSRSASSLGTLERINVACRGQGFLERSAKSQRLNNLGSTWVMNEMTSAMEYSNDEVFASFVSLKPFPLASSICSYPKNDVARTFDNHKLSQAPHVDKCNDTMPDAFLRRISNIQLTIYQRSFSFSIKFQSLPIWFKSGIWIEKLVRVHNAYNFLHLYAASRDGNVYALTPNLDRFALHTELTEMVEAEHIQVGQDEGRPVELVDMIARSSLENGMPVTVEVVVLTKGSITKISTDVCGKYKTCRSCLTLGNSSYPYAVCGWVRNLGVCSAGLDDSVHDLAICPAWDPLAKPTVMEVKSQVDVQLTCPEAASEYTWFSGGKAITGATMKTLTVSQTSLSLGDNRYFCMYPFSHHFIVRVSKAPKITSNMGNVTIAAGERATLSCTYASTVYPMPQVQWRYFALGSSVAQNVSTLPWIVESGSTLIVLAPHAGQFQCTVSNSAGSDVKSVSTHVKNDPVTVPTTVMQTTSSVAPAPPTFAISQCPQSHLVTDPSERLVFTCIVSGDQSTSISFRRLSPGGVLSSQHAIQDLVLLRAGVFQRTLVMTNVTSADQGYYECLATIGLSTSNCSFLVAVQTQSSSQSPSQSPSHSQSQSPPQSSSQSPSPSTSPAAASGLGIEIIASGAVGAFILGMVLSFLLICNLKPFQKPFLRNHDQFDSSSRKTSLGVPSQMSFETFNPNAAESTLIAGAGRVSGRKAEVPIMKNPSQHWDEYGNDKEAYADNEYTQYLKKEDQPSSGLAVDAGYSIANTPCSTHADIAPAMYGTIDAAPPVSNTKQEPSLYNECRMQNGQSLSRAPSSKSNVDHLSQNSFRPSERPASPAVSISKPGHKRSPSYRPEKPHVKPPRLTQGEQYVIVGPDDGQGAAVIRRASSGFEDAKTQSQVDSEALIYRTFSNSSSTRSQRAFSSASVRSSGPTQERARSNSAAPEGNFQNEISTDKYAKPKVRPASSVGAIFAGEPAVTDNSLASNPAPVYRIPVLNSNSDLVSDTEQPSEIAPQCAKSPQPLKRRANSVHRPNVPQPDPDNTARTVKRRAYSVREANSPLPDPGNAEKSALQRSVTDFGAMSTAEESAKDWMYADTADFTPIVLSTDNLRSKSCTSVSSQGAARDSCISIALDEASWLSPNSTYNNEYTA